MTYHLDEIVQIRGPGNQWQPARIAKLTPLIVEQSDGRRRTIIDPTAIRRGEPASDDDLLDKPLGREYNTLMAQITINQFNVTLPEGSTSARLEHELQPVTDEMNHTPLKVNRDTWQRNLQTATEKLAELERSCHQLAGTNFRPNATADCVVIFAKRGRHPRQTSTGRASISKELLQEWAHDGDDLAAEVIKAREARTRLSQLEAWQPYAAAGSVQCQWNQLGTPHGRYSCEEPNLQNRINEIRETIEAAEGYQLISFDLGQAEYVTWASLSNDPILGAAFRAGKDFHLTMWREIEAVLSLASTLPGDPRDNGKTINFALLYLMQYWTLARRLGIDNETAKQLLQAYRNRAPTAAAYMDNYTAAAQKTGVTRTYFGRQRELPELCTAHGPKLHEVTKTAWHHHNAGTAAELLKIKQLKAWKALRRNHLSQDTVRFALQMHDEIILQVRTEDAATVTDLVMDVFNQPVPGFLPFKIDCRAGRNWQAISK